MFDINGQTKQLGIIGYPIEHTFSPRMHNFISETLHKDYIYTAYLVEPKDLKDAIEGVRALNIRGINVTAPHKKEVMKYLNKVDKAALELGAVNTVVNEDGFLTGYNTDADGFCRFLATEGVKIKDSRILIMGAGGVTRPTLIRLIDNGAREITVLNRTMAKAESLKADIMATKGFEIKTAVKDWHFDIVINTTSAGMAPQEESLPIDSIDEIESLDFIDKNTACVDMIYNPEETRFLKECKKRGAKTLNGLGMLIYQGIIAYELFTGESLDDNMGAKIRKEVFGR